MHSSVDPDLSQLDDQKDVHTRPKVLVLYVGGTLGMAPNEHGALEPKKGYLTQEMKRMTELTLPSMPLFDILEYEVLFDSSDMGPEEWGNIAKDIFDHYYDYDGFLVAHGTDTMHYTATALSFMLYNLSKPVILTGAMVPLIETYNDARRNLIIGMMFAANTQLCEVCIFFHDKLMRGNRVVKTNFTVDPFACPNLPPLAEISGDSFVVRDDLVLQMPSGPFLLHLNMFAKVLAFDLCPEFDCDALEATLLSLAPRAEKKVVHGKTEMWNPALSAIILSLTGLGEKLSQTSRICRAAERASIAVFITTQSLHGKLSSRGLHRLSTLTHAFICVEDMTTTCAFVKTLYLLGRGLPTKQVQHWMGMNLRGEVSSSALQIASNL